MRSTWRQFSGNSTGPAGFTMMMINEMMTNERKIWEAALLLVRRHGSDAVADRRARGGAAAAATTS